jgi:hypothetical protein
MDPVILSEALESIGMKQLVALIMIAFLVPTAAMAKNACKDEKAKFCKEAKAAGKKVNDCLKEHIGELSPACKAQVEAPKAPKSEADKAKKAEKKAKKDAAPKTEEKPAEATPAEPAKPADEAKPSEPAAPDAVETKPSEPAAPGAAETKP